MKMYIVVPQTKRGNTVIVETIPGSEDDIALKFDPVDNWPPCFIFISNVVIC